MPDDDGRLSRAEQDIQRLFTRQDRQEEAYIGLRDLLELRLNETKTMLLDRIDRSQTRSDQKNDEIQDHLRKQDKLLIGVLLSILATIISWAALHFLGIA